MLREMESSSTVTIAAVNSIAFGGGCEIMLACDLAVLSEDATSDKRFDLSQSIADWLIARDANPVSET